MKKIVRLLAAALVICSVCLSFSGCDKITELQNNKGYYDKDGNIILGDTKYVSFPITDEMYFDYENKEYIITEEGVPVLIGLAEGERALKSKDGIFLSLDYESIYCRSDKLDEMTQKYSKEHDYTKLIYSYNDTSVDDIFDYGDGNKVRELTNAETEAIQKVIHETGDIKSMDDIWVRSDFIERIEIFACTDDLVFRKSALTIWVLEDEYFIELYDEAKDESIAYQVPSNENKIFKTIVKEYIDSMY